MTVKYKSLVNVLSAWWNIKSRTEFTEEIVGVVLVRKCLREMVHWNLEYVWKYVMAENVM